jgi:hypothetical protein
MKVVVVALAAVLFIAACPERKEAIDKVGGAPKEMVDTAKERIGKAEDKLQGNAEAAAQASE